MKTLFAILLTASAAFAQATVKVEHVAPNCGSIGFLDQLSSGCFWPKIQITSSPSVSAVIGFMLITSYTESNGQHITRTDFAFSRSADGTFVFAFPDPTDITSINVTAVELLAGTVAHTP